MKSSRNQVDIKKAVGIAAVLLLNFSLALSCAKKNAPKPLELISSDLFSNRPTNLTNVAVLIKLKGPSLIEGAQKTESGELVIDQRVKEALLNEQADTLAEAKALSDDVKLLFSYRFTVNALALSVPAELYDQVGSLGTVASIEGETVFERPEIKGLDPKNLNQVLSLVKENKAFEATSVSHIGATRAHEELGVRGKGIKVGIIDTGIDYTHKMLGGTGDVQLYLDMDKEKPTPHFPNKKVVGGYDFAGTDYSPGAVYPDWRVPSPDVNPIDEGGHGTHVAGSVAGIGDGVNTYDGVAPDADLYALKVFGNNGGTSDTVVIAAMEWAMDPNGDLNPEDRLDVINLSLGGNFGKPYILYSLAVKNIAKAGMMAVISAGNSGPTPYIVGAPGTAEESLSVGASIDGMAKNWKFSTVGFTTPAGEEVFAKRVAAAFAPTPDQAPIQGKLVYVGEAATDFDEETKAKLKGNVAFIDRGSVSFVEKVTRAEEAGAIGAVVANNQPGDPIVMGGVGKASIPAVMITLDLGNTLKKDLPNGDVVTNFGATKKIEEPALVDTLTSFSSQGPRSEDGLLKPEIAAPGFQIISARMGTGDQAVPLNGTSMSSPHMAGVMALVKEKFPEMSIEEQKAVVMNTAKDMQDTDGNTYSVTLQGAGLVQVYRALQTELLAMPASLSLGEFQLEKEKVLKRTLTVRNMSDRDKTYVLNFKGEPNIQVEEKVFSVAANSEESVSFKIKLTATKDQGLEFHEGKILINEGPHQMASIPVLGVSKRLTKITATDLNVFASSNDDAFDALTELEIKNDSTNSGEVLAFNLLGLDEAKPSAGTDRSILSRSCDLQAVGYRIVNKGGIPTMQFGVKIYSPVSSWQACELSILIDKDGDQEPDQEIGGMPENYLSGLDSVVQPGFYSVLLDFQKVVAIRQAHEQSAMANNGKPEGELNYVPAIMDLKTMTTYANSHLAVMEIDPQRLAAQSNGRLSIKVTVFSEGGVQSEDSLQNKWLSISPFEEEQSFRQIPETIKMEAGKTKTVELTKGHGSAALMLVAPYNRQVQTTQTTKGDGLQVIKPQF